jgi:lipopolysaccharide export system ATP-binding protein
VAISIPILFAEPLFLPKIICPMLTITTKDLIKSYRNRTVVNHVSIEVSQGQIVGLLGPNGAGKTTSFYMVVGLIRPDDGKVFLNEQDITKLPMYKRAQMGIGYLPQEASVFRKLSVEDNISAVLEMTKLTKAEQKAKLESLLDEFNLHHVRKNNGDSLSGGERRRTEIARALAVDPKFILLDEPFAGVDPIAVEDIQSVVARLKYRNIGILITDHNVNETLSICDRAYLLIDGKIFKQGTADELAEDEEVRRLYLGTNFVLRRKDWLMDASKGEQMTLAKMVENVERAINYVAQKQQEAAEYDKAQLNARFANSEEDLGMDDMEKYINALYETLLEYGGKHKNLALIGQLKNLKNTEELASLHGVLSHIVLALKGG